MAEKKTWKDVTSISAAKKAGLTSFKGKDGKKKLAVTKETLDAWKKKNKGRYKGSALTAWANSGGKDLKSKVPNKKMTDMNKLRRSNVEEGGRRSESQKDSGGGIKTTELERVDGFIKAKPNVRTGPKTGGRNSFSKVEPRPKTRLDNKGKRKEWDKKFGNTHNHDGTPKMSSKGYSIGGMMPTTQRKINPTTGLSMNKGGMSDMRKTGMFYSGGMTSKKGK